MGRLTDAEYQRRYRERHPERVVAAVRRWQAKNRDHLNVYARERRKRMTPEQREKLRVSQRRHSLHRRYGITPEQYNEMLTGQGGHCALCPRTPDMERFGSLCVDHCHKNGHVRGLLCTPCNHALGVLENGRGMSAATEYANG